MRYLKLDSNFEFFRPQLRFRIGIRDSVQTKHQWVHYGEESGLGSGLSLRFSLALRDSGWQGEAFTLRKDVFLRFFDFRGLHYLMFLASINITIVEPKLK